MTTIPTYSFRIDPEYNLFIIQYLQADEETSKEYEVGPPETLLNPLFEDRSQPAILHHLISKDWVSIGMLYDLAAKIEDLFPNHNFDWQKTFYQLEFADHISDIGDWLQPDTKDPEEGRTAAELVASLRVRLDYSQVANNDQVVQKRITREVQAKLLQLGLVRV